MKNSELLELIIDEEDESGVDYIALVDSPAIESEWLAFKKQQFEETFNDYPESASNNAKKAIEYKEEKAAKETKEAKTPKKRITKSKK